MEMKRYTTNEKRQALTSLWNNRKIIPSATGDYTIRELISGHYVIIVHFQHWKKSHCIDCSNPIPFSTGKLFRDFKSAQLYARKHLRNCLAKPKLHQDLAKSDTWYKLIAPWEINISYKN